MSTVRGIVVAPGCSPVLRDIAVDLEVLQAIVGGFLEAIGPSCSCLPGWHGYVNENGRIEKLPLNPLATLVAYEAGRSGGDLLVGTVLFLGNGEDGDEADVPESFVDLVRQHGWVAVQTG